MPLSVETPAPVSTTQGPAERSSCASRPASANAREQLHERKSFERVDHEVRVRQVELSRHRVRNSDAEDLRRAGGFDIVLGNPPYVKLQNMMQIDPEVAAYLTAERGEDTEASAQNGNGCRSGSSQARRAAGLKRRSFDQ